MLAPIVPPPELAPFKEALPAPVSPDGRANLVGLTRQELAEPGIKVLHSPGFDFRTTVPTLHAALHEVKGWSDAHPRHVEWLKLCDPMQLPLPGEKSWSIMEPVYFNP